MQNKSGLVAFLYSYRLELLIAAFVVQMVISPAADYHPGLGAFLAFSIGLMTLAAASFMANTRIVRLLVLPAAGLWLVARIFQAFGNRQQADARLAPLAGLLLSCAVLLAIFDRLRLAQQSTATTIAEAFMGYLVMGIAFAQLYWILNQVLDKPFNQFIPSFEISTFLYFSLITLTSVGYGGIIPINPYVRMVAAFEGVAGVFYIAVVVARLVSSYRTAQPPRG